MKRSFDRVAEVKDSILCCYIEGKVTYYSCSTLMIQMVPYFLIKYCA